MTKKERAKIDTIIRELSFSHERLNREIERVNLFLNAIDVDNVRHMGKHICMDIINEFKTMEHAIKNLTELKQSKHKDSNRHKIVKSFSKGIRR